MNAILWAVRAGLVLAALAWITLGVMLKTEMLNLMNVVFFGVLGVEFYRFARFASRFFWVRRRHFFALRSSI
jgi:hypothetical protein